MENKIACSFCKYLCRNNIISYEYYDVYVYGTELLLSFFSSVFVILMFGLASNTFLQTIIHLIIFIGVRRYTGGYHAHTYLKCKIITVGTYILVQYLSKLINVNFISYITLGISGIITIYILGPVENPHKPLTELEKRKHRKTSCVLFIIIAVLGCILSVLCQSLGNVVFFSLTSIVTLMLITIF